MTDGLIILRYLFGLRDEPLVLGVISPDSQRSETSLIVNYLENLSAPLPEFSSSDFFEVEENQKEIGLISVNYALDGPLTFSVSKDFLTISQDGMLSFAEAPDYETEASMRLCHSIQWCDCPLKIFQLALSMFKREWIHRLPASNLRIMRYKMNLGTVGRKIKLQVGQTTLQILYLLWRLSLVMKRFKSQILILQSNCFWNTE